MPPGHVFAGLVHHFGSDEAIDEVVFDSIDDLDKIDWPLMQSRFWNATDSDPDRPRRRQAEFLIHHSVPIKLVEEIVVFDRSALAKAENCLQSCLHRPIIRVNKDWYF